MSSDIALRKYRAYTTRWPMLLRADVDGNANNRIFGGESAHLQCRTRQSRESETRVKPCQC